MPANCFAFDHYDDTWIASLLTSTDAYELLRCKAAPAILQTFEIR